MKISELIKELQEKQNRFGDLELVHWDEKQEENVSYDFNIEVVNLKKN